MKPALSILMTCLFPGFFAGAVFGQAAPAADLTNGVVQARIYLPDTGAGYYRGTRFDWSGVMPELTWKGHHYCSVWFDKYDPRTHDAVMGPVEAFSPLGYAATPVGGSFMVVGVGILEKPDTNAYSPFRYYTIRDAGNWTIKAGKSAIQFIHRVNDSAFGYRYAKNIRLRKGKPEMTIGHAFTNLGRNVVTLEVYNHNLFVFDDLPTGPGYRTRLAFRPAIVPGTARCFGERALARLEDSSICFNRAPQQGESVYAVLSGYGDVSSDYAIRMENHISGAALEISSDQPLSKMVFWGSVRIFSPEPYIRLVAEPGKTVHWTLRYRFYEVKK